MLQSVPSQSSMDLGKLAPKVWGAGPEWLDPLGRDLEEHLSELGCMEIIPENFFDSPARCLFLESLARENIPTLIHAVGLSLGTDAPLKKDHLRRVLDIASRVNSVSLSEHLSMTEAANVEIGQLTPLPWSVEQADVVIRKIESIQRATSLPFSIEHVAYRFFYPWTEMSETAFINRIIDRTGCGLILDLQNLYCNAKNAQYDPYQWLEEIDLQAVTTIHLAGGFISEDGTYQDGHNHPVSEPVWELLNWVLARVVPSTIIVERTGNYPGVEVLMEEVRRADAMLWSAVSRLLEKDHGQPRAAGCEDSVIQEGTCS